MMPHPPVTPVPVYYTRNMFFTILVLLSIAVFFYFMFEICMWVLSNPLVIGETWVIGEFLLDVVYTAWAIKILRQRDFFYTGNLTRKCSLWLWLAGVYCVAGIAMAIVHGPFVVPAYSAAVIIHILIYLCYRYWSFFRPWKQVQNQVYVIQPPTPMMMQQQPSIVIQQQPSPMMMQQPHPQYVPPQKN